MYTILKWDFFMERKDGEILHSTNAWHIAKHRHGTNMNDNFKTLFEFMLIIYLAVVTCIGMSWAFSYKTYKTDFLRKCFTA